MVSSHSYEVAGFIFGVIGFAIALVAPIYWGIERILPNGRLLALDKVLHDTARLLHVAEEDGILEELRYNHYHFFVTLARVKDLAETLRSKNYQAHWFSEQVKQWRAGLASDIFGLTQEAVEVRALISTASEELRAKRLENAAKQTSPCTPPTTTGPPPRSGSCSDSDSWETASSTVTDGRTPPPAFHPVMPKDAASSASSLGSGVSVAGWSGAPTDLPYDIPDLRAVYRLLYDMEKSLANHRLHCPLPYTDGPQRADPTADGPVCTAEAQPVAHGRSIASDATTTVPVQASGGGRLRAAMRFGKRSSPRARGKIRALVRSLYGGKLERRGDEEQGWDGGPHLADATDIGALGEGALPA